MNNRKITKYAIYTVAVLCATLINEFIIKYVKKHVDQQGYILVLIDMLIVVLIFAPAFALVSNYTKKLSKAYLKTSKKMSSNNNGILLGFIAAIIILFILFASLRHNISVIRDLKALLP
ncbi:hypothetical protein [Aquimarina muelleri]|uniref:Uncharacterized protein n=1 Tax=Aquimarina muelleri TaxID=279356 RepID=A0A918JUX0_9FLAO|nr:hypothetical protein [Aquimarina muelleri]MCX2761769.1 hypothetical protein [Aquimarina muelleri]GGX16049.1 hypothetical protein GCM10007384_17000 [Aquimarina muelleri]